jgi:hypothetical protein
MTLEETLAAILDQRLAPLRRDLDRVAGALEALRSAMPPALVPLKQAAALMHVSEKTARRRVDAGEWPARRDGKKILVDVSSLRPMTEEEVEVAARKVLTLTSSEFRIT